MCAYAPEYSAENINKITDVYAGSLDPYYNRAGAQIANYMGGKGTLYGTPGSNKLQLLQGQKMGDIGKFQSGLMQLGLGQTAQERLLSEQRAYEDPYKQAELMGMYGGKQTLAGQVGLGNLGVQQQQLAQQGTQFGQNLQQQQQQFGQTLEQTKGQNVAQAKYWEQLGAASEQQAKASKQEAMAKQYAGILDYLAKVGGQSPIGQVGTASLLTWLANKAQGSEFFQ